jgi:hypothetical protein
VENKPNYFAQIPARVRYDNSLSASEKLLYGELNALSNKEGYCWANNQYFSNLYEVDKRTIRRWLEKLKRKQYIKVKVEYVPNSKKVDIRKIWTIDSIGVMPP